MNSSLPICFYFHCYRWLHHFWCFYHNQLSILQYQRFSSFNFPFQFVDFVNFHHHSQSQQDSRPVEMIFTLIMICTSLGPIFFYCELGEIIGRKCNMFDQELYECEWHAFPIELQKLMLTFMSNTQRGCVFQGCVNTVCTRDSFKSVDFDLVDD